MVLQHWWNQYLPANRVQQSQQFCKRAIAQSAIISPHKNTPVHNQVRTFEAKSLKVKDGSAKLIKAWVCCRRLRQGEPQHRI